LSLGLSVEENHKKRFFRLYMLIKLNPILRQ
jgi:hypothetical protein